MQMWIQLKDRDEDEQFSDAAAYELHPSGVLEVAIGNDVRLYSPAYWQAVTIDTRPADEREKPPHEVNDDLKWQ